MLDRTYAEPSYTPGEVLAEKYQIESVLGRGGMGLVVSAMHLHLRERVAVKLLLPEVTHPDAVARFIREARAASKIKNEHVARVTDVGMLPSGLPYMVMEHLEGEDLSGALARRSPFALEEAVEIVLQLCEGIAAAHALGVVHRDLKPSNLFLVRRSDGNPWVKILDFGISKMTAPELTGAEITLTRSTGLMGSPFYMSPEQIRAPRSVDTRTDLWSLGVVLYQLLAGRPPFTGHSIPELSVKIAVEPSPDLPRSVPASLAAVVVRCLSKDPDDRFRNVAELADALASHAPPRALGSVVRAHELLGAARPLSVPPSSGPRRSPSFTASGERTASTVSLSAWVKSTRPRPFRRVVLYVGALAAIVLVAGLLVVGFPGPGDAPIRSPRSVAAEWTGAARTPARTASTASRDPSPTTPRSVIETPGADSSRPLAGEPIVKSALPARPAPTGASVRFPPPALKDVAAKLALPSVAPSGQPEPPEPSPFTNRKW